jgi:hypothetical protein
MLEERGADLAVEVVAADIAAQLDEEAQRAQMQEQARSEERPYEPPTASNAT